MKYGNFWMSTVGAGLLIAGTMTASHTAMQSPTLLFLAGQFKVATGHTEDGLRLMNQAAAQRDSENGKVHAAEPTAKPTQVCTKNTSSVNYERPATVREVKVVGARPKPRIMIMAKMDAPQPPLATAAPLPPEVSVTPTGFQYLSEAQRAQVIQAQMDFQRAQGEKMRDIRRATHAMVIKYVPASAGFNPADMSNIERDLPAVLGRVAQ